MASGKPDDSPGPLIISVFDASLTYDKSYVWNPNSQFKMNLIFSHTNPENIFFGISGIYNSGNTKTSNFIFSNTFERNCFALN